MTVDCILVKFCNLNKKEAPKNLRRVIMSKKYAYHKMHPLALAFLERKHLNFCAFPSKNLKNTAQVEQDGIIYVTLQQFKHIYTFL